MNHSRPTPSGARPALAVGIVAALLANYWLLEGLFADRSEPIGSWISDLSTRSESSGPIFVVLGVLSGLALAGFALLLLRELGPRAAGARRSLLRWGVIALVATGVLIVIASAAPLSCAEGLEANCSLQDDGVDVIHAIATTGEIVATVLAFALIGWGLISGCRLSPSGLQTATGPARSVRSLSPSGLQKTNGAAAAHRLGRWTLAFGVLWGVLALVTGVSYLSHGVDEVKGAFQRADQIVFGAWLVLLALGWPAAVRSAEGVPPPAQAAAGGSSSPEPGDG